jgi:hypothetical protein
MLIENVVLSDQDKRDPAGYIDRHHVGLSLSFVHSYIHLIASSHRSHSTEI